jgi:hypothetical protein
MADGTKPKNQWKQTQSSGGRTDLNTETKKAKKYHPNPENEDGFNSRWEEQGQRQSLQRQQALTGANRRGRGTLYRAWRRSCSTGPAEGFMEGLGLLGAAALGYKLGYTDGKNSDADMNAIRRAATEPEVLQAKSRLKKKLAVARILNTDTRRDTYCSGWFKQQFDEFFPPTAK